MAHRGSRPGAARFERSARFWKCAYPRRWRVARGDELLGLLLDLASPGATGVGARTAFDLLRGGWATRLREHPPLLPWLGYALIGRRIPARYRAWAKDSIESPLGPIRAVLGFLGLAAVTIALADLRVDQPFLWLMSGSIMLSQASSDRKRRLELGIKHLTPQPGEQVNVGQLVVQGVPHRRLAALAVLPWLICAFGVVALVSGVALLVSGTVAVSAMVAAVGLAAVLAAVVSARLRGASELLVVQPARDVQGLDGISRVRLVVWTAVGFGIAGLEAVAARQVPVIAVLLTLAVVGGALATTGLLATRRQAVPTEVVLVDLWRIVRNHVCVEVDEPVAGLAPMPGPLPEGLVVPQRVLGGPRYPALPV